MRNWIFPIAGQGKRTHGRHEFKPFVKILDRKMIEWHFLSLNPLIEDDDQIYFITTKYFFDRYGDLLQSYRHDYIEVIDKTVNGPAISVLSLRDILGLDCSPCIVINMDQFVDFEIKEIDSKDGFMPVYVNLDGSSSYVDIDLDIKSITRIREKQLISYYASAGIYGFGETRLLFDCIDWAIRNEVKHKDEFTIGPAMEYLLNLGGSVWPVRTFIKYDLGNEYGIKKFEEFIERAQNCFVPHGASGWS